MGDYTAKQQFYLIDGNELVNVEQDLNYNLQRADDRIKPLIEYQITDEPTVTGSSLPKEDGFKFYKTYTNSIYTYRDGGLYQDTNASTPSWSSSGLVFESGWGQFDTGDSRIGYCIYDGFVRWRGRLVATNGSELPANTLVDWVTPPDEVLPANKSKYFTVYGGNASGDFQCFRVFIPARTNADKRLEFIKYGGNSTGTDMRYLSLNSIYYPLDDPL